MNHVASRCIDIIAKSKGIPPDTITLASTFEELNIDSLDKINISFAGAPSIMHFAMGGMNNCS